MKSHPLAVLTSPGGALFEDMRICRYMLCVTWIEGSRPDWLFAFLDYLQRR